MPTDFDLIETGLKDKVSVVDLSDGEDQVATKGTNKGLSIRYITAVCGRCQEHQEISEYWNMMNSDFIPKQPNPCIYHFELLSTRYSVRKYRP